MAGTYCELYYHLIWATREREPRITPHLETELYGYIRGKCTELNVFVHALDGVEDHTHLVCSLPPALSVAEFLHKIKGASSHFANQFSGTTGTFWQPGYGALTFARRDLARVVVYVNNQKQRHRDGTLSPKMERTDEG
jgi:putative transposase